MDPKPTYSNAKFWGCVVPLSSFVLVLLVALLLPAIQSPERRPPGSSCRHNLRQIGLALHNYHDVHGCFPPAYIADADGKPMHSWRVLILPLIDQKELYDQYRFDEPWNGPHNRLLHDRIPALYYARSFPKEKPCVYSCPQEQQHTGDPTMTSYDCVVGENTIFPATNTTTYRDITDGMSNTILVVEMANSGIHWMEPRDLTFDNLPLKINPKEERGISSPHEGVAYVLIADGSVHAIPDTLGPDTLRRLLLINDGEPVGEF